MAVLADSSGILNAAHDIINANFLHRHFDELEYKNNIQYTPYRNLTTYTWKFPHIKFIDCFKGTK